MNSPINTEEGKETSRLTTGLTPVVVEAQPVTKHHAAACSLSSPPAAPGHGGMSRKHKAGSWVEIRSGRDHSPLMVTGKRQAQLGEETKSV